MSLRERVFHPFSDVELVVRADDSIPTVFFYPKETVLGGCKLSDARIQASPRIRHSPLITRLFLLEIGEKGLAKVGCTGLFVVPPSPELFSANTSTSPGCLNQGEHSI